MQPAEHTFSVPFQVRSYEVDHNQEASISSICNYFQEAAGLHASTLNFDISDLQKKGLTWVLYKLQVKVNLFPKRWDSVRVQTWPSSGDGVRAYRDYELYNQDNERLAVGLSEWMVLNIKKRRPVKMPEELLAHRFRSQEHVLDMNQKNLTELSNDHAEFILKTGTNDLDMNNHVNNVKYVDWITGYRRACTSDKRCTEVFIQYSAETKAGDSIFLTSSPLEASDSYVEHTLYKNQNRDIIAKAQTRWI